jgi:hypothetical protein
MSSSPLSSSEPTTTSTWCKNTPMEVVSSLCLIRDNACRREKLKRCSNK